MTSIKEKKKISEEVRNNVASVDVLSFENVHVLEF
jgi:hypothetical protein